MISARSLLIALGATSVWEFGWWARRLMRRGEVYAIAQKRAETLQKPLIVIGAPDGGVTAGYGCGDATVDIASSACPHSIRADITKPLPFADDSGVVFVSCTLEYVADANAALREIMRISGGEAYFVGVEPWTLTAYLYPGAKRTLLSQYR